VTNKHIVCPQCRRTNRIPENRISDGPRCGACKSSLLDGKPVDANQETLLAHVAHNDIPVVVDFWAPWCGPCRMMAPAFARAAQSLSLRARFLKIDTEAETVLANQYGIRSIPTLVVFLGGREIGRMSGALDSAQLEAWIERTVVKA